MVYKIGRSIPYLYDSSVDKIKVVIACDTRVSSSMFASSLVSGLMASGAKVYFVGLIPSGGLSYLSKVLKASAGVMITASHNPVEYNGVKIFNGNGFKLTKSQQMQIERLLEENKFDDLEWNEIGTIIQKKKANQMYQKYLMQKADGFFDAFHLVLDCANGASSKLAPRLFQALKANVTVINASKNGLHINDNCGATNTKALQLAVKTRKNSLGFAFDGDADRLVVIDELGEEVTGETLLFLLATYFKETNNLKNNKVVTTVMSNTALIKELNKKNIQVEVTKVGDESVIEALLVNNLVLGAETSGHYVFKNEVTTADGLLSSIMVLNMLKHYNKPLSELKNKITLYPQIQKNIAVKKEEKDKIMESEALTELIIECNKMLEEKGRILVRKSGTEHIIRILVEGEDNNLIHLIANKIEDLIHKLTL